MRELKADSGKPVLHILRSLLQPMVAVVLGLGVGALVTAAIGENVAVIFGTMFKGGFGTLYYLMATLTRSVPIILCGLGAVLSWRAGFYNIGGEGQLVVGGFVAAVTAIYLPLKGVSGIIVVLAAGAVAGGLYSLFAAWLRERFGAVIVITTLMFNYIANFLTFYMVSFPLKDVSGDGIVARTRMIGSALWLPRFTKGSTFSLAFPIAILACLVVLFVIRRTVFGYESRMGGLNPDFAKYGGVKLGRVMLMAMFGSGALAGLGGALEVLGLRHYYMHGMLSSPGYAWTGLMAALISNLNPVGTVVASIFLAGIQTGGAAVERSTNVPLEITMVIQASMTIMVSSNLLGSFLKKRRQTVKPASPARKEK